ncbi:mitochondrial peptide methionine sulfoxide reductase [Triplophysa rosa]|uniref:peptide-methionine (S)-S-oxide reductase n=1 Tax=Triplophysa rosa TaxID=992332 RepID=A0A9W7TJI7_TRIRA|nr:mitochondrial peptide methionine sulfoxide reductase [Triplophysa rosa]
MWYLAGSFIESPCLKSHCQAQKLRDGGKEVLTEEGFGAITTEIAMVKEFYYAEDYHQQYLSKNPNGYCGLDGTGVSCPIGLKSKN